MTIISFEGGLGSGKTLGMTFFIVAEHILMNKTVFVNYKLERIKFHPLDMNEMLVQMTNLQDVAIGIDEFHVFCDSRSAGKSRNRLISYFALQTRKRNVSLYFTTQFLDQVDKRLRRLVDYRIYCNTVGGDWFQYDMIDLTQTVPSERSFFLNGKGIYDHYSTDEIKDILEEDKPKAKKHQEI